jgi:sigma-B regulation protein RsbU (phosphoserine phosphatase)
MHRHEAGTMIKLGEIAVVRPSSIREARNKVRAVAEAMLQDSVWSTRLATATSELGRLILNSGPFSRIEVGIDDDRTVPGLCLDFFGDVMRQELGRVASFFDDLRDLTDESGEAFVRGFAELPGSGKPSQELVDRLRSIVEKKSRDELMSEIQTKNLELQESLDNLRRTRSAKDRMESELNIGREIQMSMLPLTFPAFPDRRDFDVHAGLFPAREVGGDFYDLFLIDDQHFCYCVGDVSGKGVPAALFMAVTKTLIKSRAANDLSPASILSHVNTELSHNNDSCMFVTIFLGILDLKTGETVYTNAGHNPPILRRSHGELIPLDARHGPIIGAAEGLAYREDVETLAPGDCLFLYTDGVTEAMDKESRLYGDERLVDVLNAHEFSSTKEMVQASVDDVWAYQGDAEQADDVTVMAVAYFGAVDDSGVHRLELTAANRLEEIDVINQNFNEFSEKHVVPEAIRRRVNLVFDELLNNIISYAYGDEEEHVIEVVISLAGDRLGVSITDDGRPFNPFEGTPPDTDLAVDDRPIGGLGVHIVQNVMDEVAYERHGTKNVVTLVKNIAPESDGK